jgi:hypothetical protein
MHTAYFCCYKCGRSGTSKGVRQVQFSADCVRNFCCDRAGEKGDAGGCFKRVVSSICDQIREKRVKCSQISREDLDRIIADSAS